MNTVPYAPTLSNMTLRYATCHGEPGYALRSDDRRVFFVDHDAGLTQLTDADLPHLVLLGNVNTAERQHLLDTVAGGCAHIACSRTMQVA